MNFVEFTTVHNIQIAVRISEIVAIGCLDEKHTEIITKATKFHVYGSYEDIAKKVLGKKTDTEGN